MVLHALKDLRNFKKVYFYLLFFSFPGKGGNKSFVNEETEET